MTENILNESKVAVINLRLVGGSLCLDFSNTVGGRKSETGQLRNDRLQSYSALIWWGQHVGMLEENQVLRLLDEGAQHPAEADAILMRAKMLREAIYHIFSAPAHSASIAPESLHILNAALVETMAHARIVENENGHFVWGWADDEAALDRVLWDVVRSAADLLIAPERLEVRECDSPTCSWLFLDASKNHHRRWCSMEECGNRAKVRKHRQKQQTT